MTQPAPAQQQQGPSQAQVAALGSVLASSATTAGVVAALASLSGLPTVVAGRLFRLVPRPAAIPGVAGPAARQVAAMAPAYRAAYLLNAAERIKAAMAAGKSLDEAVAAEARFAQAHLHAQDNRVRAANAVDRMAARRGSLTLGWRAVKDARTTPECLAADGKNFRVDRPPLIGYPGMTHPHCRCRAVPAIAGGGWVDNVTAAAARERKAAVA